MRGKNFFHAFVLVALVWLGGCSESNKNTLVTGDGVPVRVQKVELSKDEQSSYFVGIVEESISVPVSFLTIGQVDNVYVSEGQKVNKGQLLAELNNTTYLSMYQMSLAKEKQADDAFNRLSELYKKGSLPEIKYIEIQTGVEQAHSATQIALKNLNDCKLYAPISGIIGKRSIEPGSSVLPAISVFNLVKIDKVFVKVSIPENEISKIKIGQKAKITVAALDGEEFGGTIEERGVMANPLSHTYDIKIALSNQNEKLLPGMVSNVYLLNDCTSMNIVVPNNAIVSEDGNKKYVYVVDKSIKKAEKRQIILGGITNSGIIVKEGLSQGEVIIVEGCQKLYDKSPIHIII